MLLIPIRAEEAEVTLEGNNMQDHDPEHEKPPKEKTCTRHVQDASSRLLRIQLLIVSWNSLVDTSRCRPHEDLWSVHVYMYIYLYISYMERWSSGDDGDSPPSAPLERCEVSIAVSSLHDHDTRVGRRVSDVTCVRFSTLFASCDSQEPRGDGTFCSNHSASTLLLLKVDRIKQVWGFWFSRFYFQHVATTTSLLSVSPLLRLHD